MAAIVMPVPTSDLRPQFTAADAARVTAGRAMRVLDVVPDLELDPDVLGLLRDGLGRYDMEIRWLARLDEQGVLSLWRSWTGFQIYEARIVVQEAGARFASLAVETDPERYGDRTSDEPGLFERVLISSVNHLRRFRAGHIPYGPSAGAGPEPAPWP